MAISRSEHIKRPANPIITPIITRNRMTTENGAFNQTVLLWGVYSDIRVKVPKGRKANNFAELQISCEPSDVIFLLKKPTNLHLLATGSRLPNRMPCPFSETN